MGFDARLDDPALGRPVRLASHVEHLGERQDGLLEVVHALARLAAGRHHLHVAAVVFELDAPARQVPLDDVNVEAGHVGLVDGHDKGHAGGADVLERLDRLRLHAVVGRHHEHDNVGNGGTALPHRQEGGVAGRVEKGYHPAVRHADGKGANVLRDAAVLLGRE